MLDWDLDGDSRILFEDLVQWLEPIQLLISQTQGVIGSYVSLEGKVQVMEREVADDSILATWASVHLRS